MTPLPAGWKPRLGCPFCGSNCLFTEPDEVGSGGQWVSPIHVGCNDCKAEQVGDTEDEAVSRWNARSTPPASAQDDAKVYHFEQRSRFGPWIEVEKPTERSVEFVQRAAAPAAGDARDDPMPEWVACDSRRPWVTNSLKASAQELREKEKRCRTAFNKDFMGVPSRYVADAYAEAAAVFEAKLASIAAHQSGQGEK